MHYRVGHAPGPTVRTGPELLGGGRTIMISMLVSRNVELYDQWGAASAVGVVLLVAVGLIFFLVSRFVPLDRVLGQK